MTRTGGNARMAAAATHEHGPAHRNAEAAYQQACKALEDVADYSTIMDRIDDWRFARREFAAVLLDEDMSRRPQAYRSAAARAGALSRIHESLAEPVYMATWQIREQEKREFADINAPARLRAMFAADPDLEERTRGAWAALERAIHDQAGSQSPQPLDYAVHFTGLVAREILILHTVKIGDPEAAMEIVRRRIDLPEGSVQAVPGHELEEVQP